MKNHNLRHSRKSAVSGRAGNLLISLEPIPDKPE